MVVFCSIKGPIYPSSLAVAGQWSPAFERSTILVLIVSGQFYFISANIYLYMCIKQFILDFVNFENIVYFCFVFIILSVICQFQLSIIF